MTFSQKLINVSFSLASGNFGSGGNSYTASGLRTSCHVEIVGDLQGVNCKVAIFGLPLSVMNQLTTLGRNYIALNNGSNIMSIYAGDASGMSLVFQGGMWECFIDGQAMPQICLRAEGRSGSNSNIKPNPPISFNGPVKASMVAQKIAEYLGLTLIDNGVTAILASPYFASDAVTMIQKLSEHAGFGYVIDRGSLIITPPGGSGGGGAFIAPPPVGRMVGYPIVTSGTIIVKSEFDPSIKWSDTITVQSTITPACGQWYVSKIEHDLESFTPHGKWFTTLYGMPNRIQVAQS